MASISNLDGGFLDDDVRLRYSTPSVELEANLREAFRIMDSSNKKQLAKSDRMIRSYSTAILEKRLSDKPSAEMITKRLYTILGLKQPKQIKWFSGVSHFKQAKTPWAIAFSFLDEIETSGQRWNFHHADIESQLNRLIAMVGGGLGSVPLSRRAEVFTSTGARRIGTRLFNPVATSSSLAGSNHPHFETDIQFNAFYHIQAYANYATVKNEYQKVARLLADLSLEVGGFVFGLDEASLIERPMISLDTNGSLHNEQGAALEWKDGTTYYALDGVWFDKKLWKQVTSDLLTSEQALKIVDVDQRSIAIKYLGAEKMIEALDAKCVDRGIKRHYMWEGRAIKRLQEGGTANITIQNKLYRTYFFNRDRPINRLGIPRHDPNLSYSDPRAKYFLSYNDPSTGKPHISFCTDGVHSRGEDADAVMAWKHSMTKDQYLAMVSEA